MKNNENKKVNQNRRGIKKKQTVGGEQSLKATLSSMAFSLLLVAAVIGFLFGFRIYLNHHEYKSAEMGQTEEAVTEEYNKNKEYLELDRKYEAGYVMVQNVPVAGLWANLVPGRKEEKSESLINGQILKTIKMGTYQGETYYRLEDGCYIKADKETIHPLSSYTELSGYLAVRYVSDSGVRLRAWADFDADNVVKSVYVGDKVPIKGKVITKEGVSAYITEEGFYITTDTSYFNDYTTVKEEKVTKDEETTIKEPE